MPQQPVYIHVLINLSRESQFSSQYGYSFERFRHNVVSGQRRERALGGPNKRLESLQMSLQPATDYLDHAELEAKFKKFKKKVIISAASLHWFTKFNLNFLVYRIYILVFRNFYRAHWKVIERWSFLQEVG